MRKLYTAFLIILTISLLFACTSDNSSNSSDQASLVNKWYINKWVYNNVSQTLTSCVKQGYIQFNSNGTFERKTFYLNGASCEPDSNDAGTYTFNTATNKITVTFTDPDEGPQVEVYNNIELTATTLQYSWDEDGNGIDEYLLEFKK